MKRYMVTCSEGYKSDNDGAGYSEAIAKSIAGTCCKVVPLKMKPKPARKPAKKPAKPKPVAKTRKVAAKRGAKAKPKSKARKVAR